MEHVFSAAHNNFCHVKWSMPAPAIASCVSKINASWKKSDIENWSRRNDEDESSNVFSTINLVLEDAGGTSCRIHAFVFNSKSDFYKGVMRFNGNDGNKLCIPSGVTLDRRCDTHSFPLRIISGCNESNAPTDNSSSAGFWKA
jgi:hypothetical protein